MSRRSSIDARSCSSARSIIDPIADRPLPQTCSGTSEPEREGEQTLLSAVVEVALKPPPSGVARGDDARSGAPQLLDPAGQLGSIPLVVERQPARNDGIVEVPWLVEDPRPMEDHRDRVVVPNDRRPFQVRRRRSIAHLRRRGRCDQRWRSRAGGRGRRAPCRGRPGGSRARAIDQLERKSCIRARVLCRHSHGTPTLSPIVLSAAAWATQSASVSMSRRSGPDRRRGGRGRRRRARRLRRRRNRRHLDPGRPDRAPVAVDGQTDEDGKPGHLEGRPPVSRAAAMSDRSVTARRFDDRGCSRDRPDRRRAPTGSPGRSRHRRRRRPPATAPVSTRAAERMSQHGMANERWRHRPADQSCGERKASRGRTAPLLEEPGNGGESEQRARSRRPSAYAEVESGRQERRPRHGLEPGCLERTPSEGQPGVLERERDGRDGERDRGDPERSPSEVPRRAGEPTLVTPHPRTRFWPNRAGQPRNFAASFRGLPGSTSPGRRQSLRATHRRRRTPVHATPAGPLVGPASHLFRRRLAIGAALALAVSAAAGSTAQSRPVAASDTTAGLGHAVVFSRFRPDAELGELVRIDAGEATEHVIRDVSTRRSCRRTRPTSSTSRRPLMTAARQRSTTWTGRTIASFRCSMTRWTCRAAPGWDRIGSPPKGGAGMAMKRASASTRGASRTAAASYGSRMPERATIGRSSAHRTRRS